MSGRVRDLGYHGALAQFAEPLAVYSEVKLAFDLPRLGFRAEDIYARVVSARTQAGRHFAGLEFTSLSAEASSKIQLFVQMCIQGESPHAQERSS
jgi:adenylate cyclase